MDPSPIINPIGLYVEIYRNLHKGLLSVRHKGKVIAWVNRALIKDAVFVVQPAGNAKVRQKQVKNVHAFVRGYLIDEFSPLRVSLDGNISTASYNPYKNTSFVDEDGNKIQYSELALVTIAGVIINKERYKTE